MIKVFCDRCKREQDEKLQIFKTISIPCYIAEEDYQSKAYIEPGTNEPMSGRCVDFHLCAVCSNKVYQAAFDTIDDYE